MGSLTWAGGPEPDPVPDAAERLRSLRLLPPAPAGDTASVPDRAEDRRPGQEAPVMGGWVPGRPIEPPATNGSFQSPAASASRRAAGTDVSGSAAGVRSMVVWPRWAELVDRFGTVPLLVAGVVLVAGVGLGAGWWLGHRHASPAGVTASALPDLGGPSGPGYAPGNGAAPAADGSATTGGAGTDASGGSIVVDVAGRVRHPGLVTLPLGARVADAIAAAGGLKGQVRDPTLNLAARVGDGQLLDIAPAGSAGANPTDVGAVAGGSGAGPAGGASDAPTTSGMAAGSGAPLDLNTATEAQLEALPGIGPVLAQRILDYVSQQGGFTSVEQLEQVPGIGPSHYDEVKDLVTA